MTEQPPSTKELVAKYQLNTKKSLGQNFILDKNFTDKIARSAGDLQNFAVLEIGPGPGGLTRSILDCQAKKLIAIEKDARCLDALQEYQKFYPNRLEIINDDALKIDEEKIFVESDKFKIIANLPYNIGTLLIFKWLKILPKIESITVMLQKEVAERIVAKVNDNHYGRLAVMINLLCDSKLLFSVSKSVFIPPPKVDSAVVEIIPCCKKIQLYYQPAIIKEMEFVVFSAFNQRRKMIKSSLQNCFEKYKNNCDDKNIESFLSRINIDFTKRAENITIAEYFLITQEFLKNNN